MTYSHDFRRLTGISAPRRRHRRKRSITIPTMVLMGAAAIGGLIGAGPNLALVQPGYSDTVTGCSVTDGDTLRCDGERIRLLGIDTPELPGHCRRGRECAPGDPYAATASLADAMTGTLRIERTGQDHYGRTLAIVAGSKGDLSCWQLQHGHAIYKAKWDDGLRVARICPAAALP